MATPSEPQPAAGPDTGSGTATPPTGGAATPPTPSAPPPIYPLSLRLEGRRALVVGGGPVALRRVAGHMSTEPGAHRALTALGLRPLLDLDMRLGEGSGAALAVPLVQAAARVLRDVATFDSAGVSGAKE